MSESPHGCRRQQVLQPIFVISGFVETFGGTSPSIVYFYRRRIARGEVVNQRPASNAQFGSRQASVEVEGREQVAVHSLHQAVRHVAGPVASGQVVSFRIVRQVLFQFLYRLHYDIRNFGGIRPFVESAHSLRKGRFRRSFVAVPYLVRRDIEKLPEFPAGSVSNLYEHVKKAADDENPREKGLPRLDSRFPAVGVDGFRSVSGIQVQGFPHEFSVAFSQALFPGVFAHGRSKDALHADGDRHVDLLSFEPGIVRFFWGVGFLF